MVNKMGDCPHLKSEEQDGFEYLQNKFDEGQVIFTTKDMIRFCFSIKCPNFDTCEYHEAIAEALLGNLEDFRK